MNAKNNAPPTAAEFERAERRQDEAKYRQRVLAAAKSGPSPEDKKRLLPLGRAIGRSGAAIDADSAAAAEYAQLDGAADGFDAADAEVVALKVALNAQKEWVEKFRAGRAVETERLIRDRLATDDLPARESAAKARLETARAAWGRRNDLERAFPLIVLGDLAPEVNPEPAPDPAMRRQLYQGVFGGIPKHGPDVVLVESVMGSPRAFSRQWFEGIEWVRHESQPPEYFERLKADVLEMIVGGIEKWYTADDALRADLPADRNISRVLWGAIGTVDANFRDIRRFFPLPAFRDRPAQTAQDIAARVENWKPKKQLAEAL